MGKEECLEGATEDGEVWAWSFSAAVLELDRKSVKRMSGDEDNHSQATTVKLTNTDNNRIKSGRDWFSTDKLGQRSDTGMQQ